MKFVAIDVETANADMATICAIGIATYDGGRLVDEWYTLVNPESYFDGINVSIHGISEGMVVDAPTYRQIAKEIAHQITGAVVVTHSAFDRQAIRQASKRYDLDVPTCTWLDTATVARRTWADCARSGYGLASVCERIGYRFEHHHALEDAKASGEILLQAMQETGLDLEGWLQRVRKPIDPFQTSTGRVRRDGNPDGPLHGEVLVFTGALKLLRSEAADLAAAAGCEVAPGVTKKTTLLVVGDPDVAETAMKTSKHKKAEELIRSGIPIRILRESDFFAMVEPELRQPA